MLFIPMIQVDLIEEWDLSIIEISLLISGIFSGMMIGTIVSGIFVDNCNRKPV